MNYLSKEDLIDLNHYLYEKYGGDYNPPYNFNNEDAMDYLVEMVQHDDYYPSIFEKAALYMYNTSANHIFSDGNKRTGTFAGILFLEMNGYQLKPEISSKEVEQFALRIAKSEIGREEVTEYLVQNTEEK